MATILLAALLTFSASPATERPADGGREFLPPPTAEAWDGTVEYWRPLVEKHWDPQDVAWAMVIIDCESDGNPYAKNPNSSASGLFQQLARYWDDRARDAGWAGASVFDPEANIAVSAHLFSWGGKSHWECKA
jgi:soluble lytic murein transglycosylase-like protein